MRIALFRKFVQGRAAGIGQAQHTCRLVKGFPRRVVHGLTQQAVFPVVPHLHQMAVAPGHHQAHKGRLQLRIRQVIGGNVTLNMVDGDQRLARGIAQALHAAHPGKQRAHQPGAIGYGTGVHLLQGQARLLQRLVHHPVACLHMGPAGNFRHYPAIQRVQVNL